MVFSRVFVLFLWAILVLKNEIVFGQVSTAFSSDSQILSAGNKFLSEDTPRIIISRERSKDEEPLLSCPQNLELKWMRETSSPIYATPLITDLRSDGKKDIIVPTFKEFLEALEGPDGSPVPGWPAAHSSSVHVPPMLYDIDHDGVNEVVLLTYDGEILFFGNSGELLSEHTITLAPLKVRRDWFVGLDSDPIDHSHLDVSSEAKAKAMRHRPPPPLGPAPPPEGTFQFTAEQAKTLGIGLLTPPYQRYGRSRGSGGSETPRPAADEAEMRRVEEFLRDLADKRSRYGVVAAKQQLREVRRANPAFYARVVDQIEQERAAAAQSGSGSLNVLVASEIAAAAKPTVGSGSESRGRRLLEVDDSSASQEGAPVQNAGEAGQAGATTQGTQNIGAEGNGHLSDEAADSFKVFDNQMERKPPGGGGDAGAGHDEAEDHEHLSYDELRDALLLDEFGQELLNNTGNEETERSFADRMAHYRHRYNYLYDDDGAHGWGDYEHHAELPRVVLDNGESFVHLDAHVIGGAAIGDLDGDGQAELVVAVSYFFDRQEFERPERAALLKNVSLDKYVASGVVALDLRTGNPKWSQHLDLSTDLTRFRAYAESAPLLVDLDHDGQLEVVLGGGAGFLYVLDSSGATRPGWPLQMAPIGGRPIAVDLDGDGSLEIVAADDNGNVAAFSATGEEIWSRRVDSAVPRGPVAADVDGDGSVDIIVATEAGWVYALSGSDGSDLAHFPFRTRGRIEAPLIVTRLTPYATPAPMPTTNGSASARPSGAVVYASRGRVHRARQGIKKQARKRESADMEVAIGADDHFLQEDAPHAAAAAAAAAGRGAFPVSGLEAMGGGQQIIALSYDGHVYVIDGNTGCADSIDIGNTAVAAPLADDIDGDGRLEIVVAATSGTVYALQTPAAYHPLKAWPSEPLSPNGQQIARWGYAGIFASEESRRPRDEAGQTFMVHFEVYDKRVVLTESGSANSTLLSANAGAPYNISVVIKGVGVAEMKAGEAPMIGAADTLVRAGRHMVELPCPRTRVTATIRLEMADAQGLHFWDEFAISFHFHFHKLLKWTVAAPPLVTCLVALLAAGGGGGGGGGDEDDEDDELGETGDADASSELPLFRRGPNS